jgi:hypothetical protein
MNWEAVAAIGQLLGSAAVLITLIYLAIQVRHARREVRRSVSESRAAAQRELSLNSANNRELCRIRARANEALGFQPSTFSAALMDRTGLTWEEAYALFFEENAWWSFRTQVIPYIDELSTGERREFERVIRTQYGHTPIGRLWYDAQRSGLDQEAVRYVDRVLSDSGDPT